MGEQNKVTVVGEQVREGTCKACGEPVLLSAEAEGGMRIYHRLPLCKTFSASLENGSPDSEYGKSGVTWPAPN